MTTPEAPEPSFSIGIPEPGDPPALWWPPLVHLLAFLFGFWSAFLIVEPALCCRGHRQGQLTACKSNCKNIATALEMYASDNSGYYPRSLQQLTCGSYLKTVPTCPAACEITYINYRVTHNPDNFSFACVGNNHAKAYTGYARPCANYPRYAAEVGLIDHP